MHQPDFIRLCIELGVLRFGEFTLKSGRKSPYFFNAGLFNTGHAIGSLGRFYARTAAQSGVQFDMLFGPAYKGIPLVTATARPRWPRMKPHLSFAFNRKEAKEHGEGGTIVGAPLKGRVLIVDDVITAGTAIRESVDIIACAGRDAGGRPDRTRREERGQGAKSAVQEVQDSFGLPVIAVLRLRDLDDPPRSHRRQCGPAVGAGLSRPVWRLKAPPV